MNLPTDHAANMVAAIPTRTTRRTRRPSGEPPPLPRHLQISGVGWLAATALLVAAALLVFAGGLGGVAVAVSVADSAVVAWLQEVLGTGSAGVLRISSWPGSWAFLDLAGPALLIALLALRRFRHCSSV
jgi:hypothetical protein